MFNIKVIYPSMKEKLLWKTKRYISITKKDIETIFHTGKSLLYYNYGPLVKKGESNFDLAV